jgi:hypothetical protein
LQQTLNQSSHDDCYADENPLQSTVKELTAKNLELQAELKTYKEKAALEIQKLKVY